MANILDRWRSRRTSPTSSDLAEPRERQSIRQRLSKVKIVVGKKWVYLIPISIVIIMAILCVVFYFLLDRPGKVGPFPMQIWLVTLLCGICASLAGLFIAMFIAKAPCDKNASN